MNEVSKPVTGSRIMKKAIPSGRLGIIVGAIKLLSRDEQVSAIGIIALLVAAGFLESFVIAIIVPFVYVVVDPSKFNSTRIGRAVVEYGA